MDGGSTAVAVDTTTAVFVIRSNRRISRRGDGDDESIDRGGEEDRGGQLGDLLGGRAAAGSFGLEGELHSGMAVLRDLKAFRTLDAEMRGELLPHHVEIPALPMDVVRVTSDDNSTEDDGRGGGRRGMRGGDAGTDDDNDHLCSPLLAEYLSSLLGIPDVVGSDAMSRFLEREDADGEEERSEGAGSKEEEEEEGESESPPTFDGRNFADYIFQGDALDDETSTTSIPRRESFRHTEDLPPGWWVVWQYRVETSGPPLEFNVYLRGNDDGDGGAGAEDSPEEAGEDDVDAEEDVASSSAWSCVIHETTGQTSDVVRGSYRCEPSYHEDDVDDSTNTDGARVRCVLRFSNTASLLRGARLQLAVRCVPHEAFKAACEAAEDQARANERRRKSPLLRHILEDSSLERPVRLVVEPVVAAASSSSPRPSPGGKVQHFTADLVEKGCHDTRPMISGAGTAHPSAVVAKSPSSTGDACPRPSEESSDARPERDDDDAGTEDDEKNDREGEGGGDDSSSGARRSGSTSIDDEALLGGGAGVGGEVLAAMRAEIETLRSDVEFLNVERREWSVTESEMREGLSTSTKLLDEERGRTARLEEELEEKTREVLELRSEVDFLEGQIPTDAEIEKAKGDLRDARSETRRAHDMIDMLRAQLSEVKCENETLSAELREHRDAASDALLNATAEADEARMMQRILEGKVREMERLLVACRSGTVAAGVVAAGDVAAPGHGGDDGDGKNGGGGRRGGNGVIVKEATNGTNVGGDFAAAKCLTREETGVKGESSFGSNDDDEPRHDPRTPSSTVEQGSFVHPDPRINAQLVGLRERHGKLLAMSRSDPEDGRRNAELIRKIEDAIDAIISSASARD